MDDCRYTLQDTLPHLTRSALHRCLQRRGVSRVPDTKSDKPQKKTFKAYPIRYFHIDIAEVRTEGGKLYFFVAVDRTSKFAGVELHAEAIKPVADQFLCHGLGRIANKLTLPLFARALSKGQICCGGERDATPA